MKLIRVFNHFHQEERGGESGLQHSSGRRVQELEAEHVMTDEFSLPDEKIIEDYSIAGKKISPGV